MRSLALFVFCLIPLIQGGYTNTWKSKLITFIEEKYQDMVNQVEQSDIALEQLWYTKVSEAESDIEDKINKLQEMAEPVVCCEEIMSELAYFKDEKLEEVSACANSSRIATDIADIGLDSALLVANLTETAAAVVSDVDTCIANATSVSEETQCMFNAVSSFSSAVAKDVVKVKDYIDEVGKLTKDIADIIAKCKKGCFNRDLAQISLKVTACVNSCKQ